MHSISYVSPHILGKIIPYTQTPRTRLNSLDIHQTLHDSLRDKNQKKTMNEEMEALNKNQTWEAIDIPRGKRPVHGSLRLNTKLMDL